MKKMEREKSHSSSSELFICFTSRASSSSNSSSMKISSKSILSPGRTDKFRDGSSSSTLHSSLSRRLRSNGSMKGGQSSPMFPTGSKKKGCSFETPEPSSPKVTCIGQVRVKTKKQGKKIRSRSKRRGDVSFRKTEQTQDGQQQQECLPNRNQRWVHLPLSICEALRSFGAEFNCFLPCGGRSSCSSNAGTEREKGEKRETTATPQPTSSCGAVFARWLMVLQESEEEKRRELVEGIVGLVGEEEGEEREKTEGRKVEEKEEIEDEEVSICIPPRNALLLMRCRSEPLRMSSFASRFWDSPVPREQEEDDDDDEENEEDEDEAEEEQVVVEVEQEEEEEEKMEEMAEKPISFEEHEKNPEKEESAQEHEENPQKEESAEEHEENPENEESAEEHEKPSMKEIVVVEHEIPEKIEQELEEDYQSSEKDKAEEENKERENLEEEEEEEERVVKVSSPEVLEAQESVQEGKEEEEEIQLQEEKEEGEEEKAEEEMRSSCSSASIEQVLVEKEEEEAKATEAKTALDIEEGEEEKSTNENEKTEEEISVAAVDEEEEDVEKSTTAEEKVKRKEESERRGETLPDCLLLMMCEPKLSMEVSKETWVCSTDFLRCRPAKDPQGKGNEERNAGGDERRRVSTDSNPAHPLPANSNPTHPVPVSMATVIEQKLVNAAAYEPFVLTRCKSEPLRSSARLAPEACFWKSRKLPHVGVGAAGVGF